MFQLEQTLALANKLGKDGFEALFGPFCRVTGRRSDSFASSLFILHSSSTSEIGILGNSGPRGRRVFREPCCYFALSRYWHLSALIGWVAPATSKSRNVTPADLKSNSTCTGAPAISTPRSTFERPAISEPSINFGRGRSCGIVHKVRSSPVLHRKKTTPLMSLTGQHRPIEPPLGTSALPATATNAWCHEPPKADAGVPLFDHHLGDRGQKHHEGRYPLQFSDKSGVANAGLAPARSHRS